MFIIILETDRLILRPWKESDADSLYEYAKDPLVGPSASWPPHTSPENSLQIIRDVLSSDENLAIIFKDNGKAIGSIGLKSGANSYFKMGTDAAEVGYWIGVPYWGQGLVPEAVGQLMQYAFEELSLNTLWCSYFDGNDKSTGLVCS